MDDPVTVAARFQAAFERWIWALYYRGHLPTTEWALADGAVVWRYIAEGPPSPPQRMEGLEAINEWLKAGPAQLAFTLVPGSLTTREESYPAGTFLVGETRYELTVTTWDLKDGEWVPQPWVNHGTWRVVLASDGRIAVLEHLPDRLSEAQLNAMSTS